MKFRDVTMEDREIFREYLKTYPPRISEMTFTNIFVWAQQRKHRMTEMDDHLVIISEKEKIIYQPVGQDPAMMITKLLPLLPGYHAGRVEHDIARAVDGEVEITETSDQYDYVYELDSLRTLEGSKLRAKRNFKNKFGENNPQVARITQSLIPECLRVHDEWCKNCKEDLMLLAESDAVGNALTNFDELGIMGVVVLVGNKAVGFAIAERLNDETYVEHFEKADITFPGVSEYLNYALAKAIPQGIHYLNREQDLGIEELRKARKSYDPAFRVKKYSIEKSHEKD